MGGSVTINNQYLITHSGIELYCGLTEFLPFKNQVDFDTLRVW